jgi:zinc transport system ATP-binding protein
MHVSAPVLRMDGASVVLSGRPVLHDVDVRVGSGEVVALLGANGSGKSTLVRALVGLIPLATGQIELFGTPQRQFRQWRRIGYVPQRVTAASGVPATVREVVTSGRLSVRGLLRRLSAADRDAVEAAIASVGLADRADHGVAQLSGGQQQRVLIARAMAGRPEALILDEPTAGVDRASQEAFAHALTELVATGTTILLVAHELGPLEPLVRRAVVLRHGHVVHDGPPPRAVGQHADAGHDHVHPHDDWSETPGGWLS